MSELPKTRKKLREARFFLYKLSATDDERLDSEDFDFYLSAFLSATRSVTWAFQAEDKPRYDRSFRLWSAKLSDEEKQFLKFFVDQRDDAIHQGHSEVADAEEKLPASDLFGPSSGRWQPWSADEGAWIAGKRRFFQVDGVSLEVRPTCERYLRVLGEFLDSVE